MLMRIVGMTLFNPQLCLFSSFLGGILNFAFKSLNKSSIGFSIVIMSCVYVGV
jgi:hypothetical protein